MASEILAFITKQPVKMKGAKTERKSRIRKGKGGISGQQCPFVMTYHPAVRGLKEILMNNWVIIQNQPLLKSIYTKPPIISYKKGKSLKDTLVRAKI